MLEQHADHRRHHHGLGHLVLIDEGEDKWRGVIEPSDLNQFWLNYDSFLAHYLDIAEVSSVEIFAVGSELGSTEVHTQAWRRIIANARGRFRGFLTYSVNWDHFRVPRFFDALDLVGITGYFSLTEKDDPTVDELAVAWRRVGRDVKSLADRVDGPVFFTELGYASQDGINKNPWNYFINRERIDLQEQKDCFEAFLRVARELDWLDGAYFYDYFENGGPQDHTYSPRGKPAMDVWRQWAQGGVGR